MCLIRALLDITSSLEVQNIFKIQTVWKLDVFLPGRRTFKTFRNKKEIKISKNKKFITCPANLGVRSCLVRKLICPVRLSPMPYG